LNKNIIFLKKHFFKLIEVTLFYVSNFKTTQRK